MYDIKTEHVYEDFSNYSSQSKFHDSNKLVVGKIKDETGSGTIKEFVELKPNMYSFLVDNIVSIKKQRLNENVEK